MEEQGLITTIELPPEDIARMQADARPALEAFAEEVGAEEILANVDALRD